jgi:hypothetical protein
VLIDRRAVADKASENIIQVVTTDQPPADLLISITPGVRKLVEAATKRTEPEYAAVSFCLIGRMMGRRS